MPEDDDELRINTLHRFSKHSPRLTLQEYSHCEVPAGCGGVVLRWTDPARGPAIAIQIVTLGSADTWLDNEPLVSHHVTLGPGQHLLAFHITGLEATPTPVAITVTSDIRPRSRTNRLPEAYPLIERWAPGPQASSPADPAFDDSTWEPPPHAELGSFGHLAENMSRVFDHLARDGATMFSLGVPGAQLDQLWIRIAFAFEPQVLARRDAT